MDEEIVRLRAELAEATARAVYAAFVAELALSRVLERDPAAKRRAFLQHHLDGLKAASAVFPGAVTMAARVAGLFAAYAAKWGVGDPPAPPRR